MQALDGLKWSSRSVTPKGPINQELVVQKFDDKPLNQYNLQIRSVNLVTIYIVVRECNLGEFSIVGLY